MWLFQYQYNLVSKSKDRMSGESTIRIPRKPVLNEGKTWTSETLPQKFNFLKFTFWFHRSNRNAICISEIQVGTKFCCSLPATPVIEKTHLASISKFIKTHPGFRTQDFRNSSAAGARSPIFKLESCFLVPGSVLTWIPRKKNQQSIYGSLECDRPKSKSRYICIFDPQGWPN